MRVAIRCECPHCGKQIYGDSTAKEKATSFDARIAELIDLTTPKLTPVREIVSAVSRMTGIPECDIYGDSRRFEIAKARHMAFYFAREEGHYWVHIAEVFGKDHTTVINGANRIKAELQ